MATSVWKNGAAFCVLVALVIISVTSEESYTAIRSKRSVIPKSIAPIIEFTTVNIRRLFYPPAATIKDTKSDLNLIEKYLHEAEKDSDVIITELQAANLATAATSYLEHEMKIKDSLKSLRQYLDNPNDKRLERNFNDSAAGLPTTLHSLLNYRLPKKEAYQINIVISLRDAVHVSCTI